MVLAELDILTSSSPTVVVVFTAGLLLASGSSWRIGVLALAGVVVSTSSSRIGVIEGADIVELSDFKECSSFSIELERSVMELVQSDRMNE